MDERHDIVRSMQRAMGLDGVDGKAHYVPLNSADDMDAFPVGSLSMSSH